MLTILTGDALTRLRELPAESVQCCVTSPPYWGLRDYGTAAWEGGEAGCDHLKPPGGGTKRSGLGEYDNGLTQLTIDAKVADKRMQFPAACGKCGAVRVDQQIGLEKTPAEFVAKMVAVFEEVRRVLKKDGTCWVNLGDSYASNAGGYNGEGSMGASHNKRISKKTLGAVIKDKSRMKFCGLKAKDMVGIPWRVAFALQEDGWYLRSDIIWHKPNPMPESVTDRPTKSHEYLFLLTKNQSYYYDAEAIKEKVAGNAHVRGDGVNPKAKYKTPDGWDTGKGSHGSFHKEGREDGQIGYQHKPRSKQNESFSGAVSGLVESRNKRTVWTVPTFPCPDAHFATYPPDLIKPCILAGSRPGDTILDPFGGSGTSGQVALELGRKAILIELNPEYVKLIKQRCDVTPGLGI